MALFESNVERREMRSWLLLSEDKVRLMYVERA